MKNHTLAKQEEERWREKEMQMQMDGKSVCMWCRDVEEGG